MVITNVQLFTFHSFCYKNDYSALENFLKSYSSPDIVNYIVNSTVSEDSPLNSENDYILGFSSLHFSVINENINTIKLLLNKGADINKITNMGTPLHIAMLRDNFEIFQLLLNNGANINVLVDSENSYHILLKLGYEDCAENGIYINKWVKRLFNYGCDINHKNKDGNIPLFYSPPNNLQTFFQYGIDINIENNSQQVALTNAEYFIDSTCFIDIYVHIEKLLTIGYYVNEQNKKLKLFMLDNRNYIDPAEKFLNEENLLNLKLKLEKELRIIKSTIINNCIKLFDILILDVKEVTLYAGNKELQDLFESKHFEDAFPHFGYILQLQFKKCQERRALLQASLKKMNALFYWLPENCILQILKNMSNEELKNFI